MSRKLWNKKEEYKFFKKTLAITTPEQLFYFTKDKRFLAYWPKNYTEKKTTLQSRNTFIGNYTEKWIKELFIPFAKKFNAYAVHNVICDKIGISSNSPADVAITKTPYQKQQPENILLLIEVKMSIVWNWEYNPKNKEIKCIGDYTSHQGNPGLLRSDTMLKAIGKSINIRFSSFQSSKIPIIIIGNTPITKTYHSKVDFLKNAGIIQKFYSVNPNPIDNIKAKKNNIKKTQVGGFLRIDKINELYKDLAGIIKKNKEFFSSMLSKKELGKIIEVANNESTYEKKGEKFLQLLKGENSG